MHENDETGSLQPGEALPDSSPPINNPSGNGPSGYRQLVPVDRKKLRDVGVSQASCQQFAQAQNIAHLNLLEFFHASAFFPIAFIKQQNNSYTPCVVLGFEQGKNLFVDAEGCWLEGVYSPAYIRRYPFITEAISPDDLKLKESDIRKPVFVDEWGLEKNDKSLFIANGVATAEWENIDSFISDYIAAEQQTLRFTSKLDKLKLFEPFDAQVHPKGDDMIRLKGLYRINENKLNKLSAKTIKGLMQSGELSRIYAHLISLENFAKLLDRKVSKQ